MTAALSAQRTLFAVSTMRGGRALCRFPHRTLRVMAASSHHAGSSSSSSAQSEQRRRLVRAAASRQQTSSDGPELAESSSLKRFLISGAAAAALLLAAATPRPAAAFQMPGGLFGGAPQPAAVATKVEAAPAVMENKTPLPDLSQLSMEEIKTVTLFKENTPCVVNIANIANARRYYSTDILKIPQGQGSGFVWDHNGHIVTNYHVIRGASEVQVSLIDQSTWPATIVGGDPSKDVAVLQLQAPKEVLAELKPIELGNSSGLFVGQQVFAIGNPFGLDHTLTSGIISGLNRELNTGYGGGAALRNVIQSDASINPGNSGGPLLDSRGRLIGINTAIYDPTGKGSSSGIGFAIPIDTVRGLVDQILTYGRVVRPVLGITIAPPQALRQMGLQGVLVLDVPPGTPAAKAGLQGITRDDYGRMSIGDVIVGMNGKPVKSEGDLFGVLDDCKVGDKVTVDVLRGGNKKRTLTVQLAERVPDATE